MTNAADPVIDKALRWLDLVAELLSRRLPVTADELWRRIPAYQVNEGAALRRMFERDKDDLRTMGIPLETVVAPDHNDAGYRLRRERLKLPHLPVQQPREADLLAEDDIALLREAGARVASAPAAVARETVRDAAAALRWLGLVVPLGRPVPLPEGKPQLTAPQVFELTAAIIVTAQRRVQGAAPGVDRAMPVEGLADDVGCPAALLQRIVDRALERPRDYLTCGRVMRFGGAHPGEVEIIAPMMTRPWRPLARQVDALIGLLDGAEGARALRERLRPLLRDAGDLDAHARAAHVGAAG